MSLWRLNLAWGSYNRRFRARGAILRCRWQCPAKWIGALWRAVQLRRKHGCVYGSMAHYPQISSGRAIIGVMRQSKANKQSRKQIMQCGPVHWKIFAKQGPEQRIKALANPGRGAEMKLKRKRTTTVRCLFTPCVPLAAALSISLALVPNRGDASRAHMAAKLELLFGDGNDHHRTLPARPVAFSSSFVEFVDLMLRGPLPGPCYFHPCSP